MNKLEAYQALEKSLEGVLNQPLPFESALVSLIALIKQNLPWVSWVGVYLAKGDTLWVGPYQGKLACIEIPKGKGVCGAAFEQQKTLIVKNVHAFEGHIACDAQSMSEIVLPLWKGKTSIGVLDLDSHSEAAFDEEDQKHLETLLLRIRDL